MKVTKILFFICFVLISTACGDKTVKGNGDIISQEIEVDIYDKIKIEGALDLIYEAKPDEAGYLKVEADGNIIPLLDINVKRRTLNIKAKESINPSRFTVYTNSPTLKYVESKGASTVYLKNAVAGDELKVELKGVGHFKADRLMYEKAEFYLRGAGDMAIGGQMDKCKLEIGGNGNIEAQDLEVREMNCLIKGNGDMSVYPTEKLSLEIKGNGDINYKGNPQITKQKIKGSGMVRNV